MDEYDAALMLADILEQQTYGKKLLISYGDPDDDSVVILEVLDFANPSKENSAFTLKVSKIHD